MWYHGRSATLSEEEKALPPLSTGRVGRAISKNGLVWEKDLVGAVSEDLTGVTLGKNTESWWGFDTAHVGLGQVLLPMNTPAVMTDGGVYLMYYMGGNFEESLVSEYMNMEGDDKIPAVKGMKMKIGVALSQDGITWGRVEGDDSSGACIVPYDKTDSSQSLEPEFRNVVEEELYCGWPEVTVNTDKDAEHAFIMYYSTMVKDTKEKAIAYAVSPDGFRWSKRGVCIRPDDESMDDEGCARCSVIRMATLDEETGWSEEKGWLMFYEGVSKEDGKHRVMRAESKDGMNWKKTGVALDVGSADTWDSNGVGSPHIIRLDDGNSRMYYTGQSADGSTAIGIARVVLEKEGVFEREQAEFSFS